MSDDTAKEAIETAETGDAAALEKLKRAEKADPVAAQAAEQDLSEAPAGRGLAR